MPILSKEELDKRLQSPANLVNRKDNNLTVIQKVRNPSVKIPDGIKKTIAILSEDETTRTLSEAFGITPEAVRRISNGEDWSGKEDKVLTPIIGTVKEKRTQAEMKALDSLLTALDIVPEKMHSPKALQALTSSAKTLAEITEKMGGREKNNDSNTVHVHLYAPKQAKVEDYEVIDV